jgi:photosystem II stability/assembly factor-like uncharacterized protein
VEVLWQESPSGPSHSAAAQPISPESGYFWFFAPENVEVAVKILDGTSVNGHFWVFYGALSNVHYTVSVTDPSTGKIKNYENAAGTLASVADTEAFDGMGAAVRTPAACRTANVASAGLSWVPIGPDEMTAVFVVAVDPHDSRVVYASAGGESYRIFKTSDGGASWTTLVTFPDFAYKIVLDPHASEVVCVLTAGGAYRSTDGGISWESFGTELGIGDLEFDSVSAGTIYAGTVNGFLVSTDGGATWSARGQELAGRSVGPIETTPSGEFYAVSAFVELWSSSDAGESWTHVHSFHSEGLSSLAADPSDGSTVYASPSCCAVWPGSTPFPPAPVLKSTDSGATWAEVLGENTGSTSIVLDPVDSRVVYAGGDAGVFRSANAGTSWTRFSDGISLQRVFTLGIASGSLFAGTSGGVFGLDLAGLPGSCQQGGNSLCLNGGRFRVDVAFTRTSLGPTMPAPAVPMTRDTGYFWFSTTPTWSSWSKCSTGAVSTGTSGFSMGPCRRSATPSP